MTKFEKDRQKDRQKTQQAEQILVEIWRVVNRTTFGNQLLREPRFKIIKTDQYLGRFCPGRKRDTIKITSRFFERIPQYTMKELLVTVTHEMVHQAQRESTGDLPLDHGYFFQRCCAALGIDPE